MQELQARYEVDGCVCVWGEVCVHVCGGRYVCVCVFLYKPYIQMCSSGFDLRFSLRERQLRSWHYKLQLMRYSAHCNPLKISLRYVT